MNEEVLKQAATEAEKLACEMAHEMKTFGRNIAMLLYGKILQNMDSNFSFAAGVEHKKISNGDAAKKLNKAMQQAREKWVYATNEEKRKVTEMELIFFKGKEKIIELNKNFFVLKNESL